MLRCFQKKIILLALFFCGVTLSGCANLALFAVNTSARLNHQSKVVKDISYGKLTRQKLDLYLPKNGNTDLPVLLFIHGGSWQFGAKEDYYFLGKRFAEKGFVTVILNYRLYPHVKYPEFVWDAALALKWTQNHVAKYRGNPQKIFVMGHSAGAYMAALLNFDEKYLKQVGGNSSWIRGMIGVAGPYDFLPLGQKPFDVIFKNREQNKKLLPTYYVDGREPPTLLLHGFNDKTVEAKQSRWMAQKIRAKGGFVRSIIYPRASHAAIIGRTAGVLRSHHIPVAEDVVKFVAEVLH